MKKIGFAFAFLLVSGFAAAASADEIGDQGVLVISSEALSTNASAYLVHTTGHGGSHLGKTNGHTSFLIRPAFDYFLWDRISLGGHVGINYESENKDHNVGLGLGFRAGYAFSLASEWSIWPKVGIGLHFQEDTTVMLEIFAPITYSPTDHFFIGLGPYIAAGNGSAFGLQSAIGGYF